MPYVLRKAMLAKWETDPKTRGLTEDGLQNALEELQLQDNRLSVFLVDDHKSNVNRIVAALAATRQSPDIMEYYLLNVDELDRQEISWRKTPMDTTPDDTVNCVHVDLGIPDVDKLRELAQTLRTKGETGSFPRMKVRQMITRGIISREIDLERCRITSRSFWDHFYSVCSNS